MPAEPVATENVAGKCIGPIPMQRKEPATQRMRAGSMTT